jgi:hypothetical protein
MAARDAATRDHLAIYAHNYLEVLVLLLHQGLARGEFAAFDVNRMAATLMALLEGMSELAYIAPERFAGEAALIDAIDLVLAGVTRVETTPAPALRYVGKWGTRP